MASKATTKRSETKPVQTSDSDSEAEVMESKTVGRATKAVTPTTKPTTKATAKPAAKATKKVLDEEESSESGTPVRKVTPPKTASTKKPVTRKVVSDDDEDTVVTVSTKKPATKPIIGKTKTAKAVADEEDEEEEPPKKSPAKVTKSPATKAPVKATKSPVTKAVAPLGSDDEEEEEQPVKKASTKKPAPKQVSDDEDEQPVKKTPPKATATKKPVPKQVSDDEEEEEVKPKSTTRAAAKPTLVKKPAPKQVSDDEEEEEVKPKSAPKTAAAKKPATKPVSDEEEEEVKRPVLTRPTSRVSKLADTETKSPRVTTPTSLLNSKVQAPASSMEEVMALMTKLDKMPLSDELAALKRALPLDWSATPLTPDALQTLYPKQSSWNVVGVNVLLDKETELSLPTSILETLITLRVSSSRVSGHVLLTNIKVLAKCPNLRYLSLTHCNALQDISPLAKLTSLEQVDLTGCSKLSSLSFGTQAKPVYAFEQSPDLHRLNLSGCTNLETLMGLPHSRNLEWLSLNRCVKLVDYNQLEFLTRLTTLDLSHCEQVTETGWIRYLPLLNNLRIRDSGLRDKYAVSLRYVTSVTLGFWNILAWGLEDDAFLTAGGEKKNIPWEIRGPKLVDIMTEMMKECGILVTVENDVFFYYLRQLRARLGDRISGAYSLKADFDEKNGVPGSVHSRNIRARQLLVNFLESGEESTRDPPTDPQVLAKIKPKELADVFEDVYEELNAINKRTNKHPTFRALLGEEYGTAYASLCKRDADDIYISADGVGFYYDNTRFTIVADEKNPPHENVIDVPMWHKKMGWKALDFQLYNTDIVITVLGAHMTGGEAEKDEVERVTKDLPKILTAVEGKSHPFLLMDSNSSLKYEAAYPPEAETVSKVLAKTRFSDAVPNRGYECFKMRGTRSSQVDKRCKLMFDTIDKMLYPADMAQVIPRHESLDDFGFVRYDPAIYHVVNKVRTDTQARKDFEAKCLQIDTDDANVMFPEEGSPFRGLYPNAEAPSDHPPIVQRFELFPESVVRTRHDDYAPASDNEED